MTALRDEIDEAVHAGRIESAEALLGRLFREQPTASNAAFVNGRFEQLRAALKLTPFRLAVLRSFTIEPLVPLLRAHAFVAGVDLTVHVGDFNVVDQALLEAADRLYEFRPDAVAIAVLTRDLVPATWNGEVEAGEIDHAVARVHGWIGACRRHTTVSVVIHSFEEPALPSAGVLDAQDGEGQRAAIRRLNAALLEAARREPGVYVLDYDALVARHGRLNFHDPHKDLTMRVALRADAFGWLAGEYVRFLRALTGRTCKAIAIDLDNTVWGGIAGEDGPGGVQIGVEYPGNAYLTVQRELKTLARRGVLLAICSKNNADDATAVFTARPEMILRLEDFAAIRMNWADKAENLREIAAELNIGLDAMAFLDDNPVEREWVRARAGDVQVIDLPADPVHFAAAIRQSALFERLSLSEEDRVRTRHYRDRRQRVAAERSAGSVDAFLATLDMKATVSGPPSASLTRIAQLTQKTNQFNLTTKRYSESEIARLAADESGTVVRSIHVVDRFGDNGVVGAAIATLSGGACDIDTFVLSCRVIGRQVETALLADVVNAARRSGATTIRGWYRPTPKNAPARDFYPRHGFTSVREDEGAVLWELDLRLGGVDAPACIAMTSA